MSEEIARLFHETYERLAPNFGYETRKTSAVPWEDVPENNKQLMIAVVSEVLASIQAERDALVLRTGVCEWEYDEQIDVWNTSCSNAWQFYSDGPKENECSYCMYCGGVIEATRKEIDGNKK